MISLYSRAPEIDDSAHLRSTPLLGRRLEKKQALAFSLKAYLDSRSNGSLRGKVRNSEEGPIRANGEQTRVSFRRALLVKLPARWPILRESTAQLIEAAR